jgi:hypothetical protein
MVSRFLVIAKPHELERRIFIKVYGATTTAEGAEDALTPGWTLDEIFSRGELLRELHALSPRPTPPTKEEDEEDEGTPEGHE